jgi:hypothetical protein
MEVKGWTEQITLRCKFSGRRKSKSRLVGLVVAEFIIRKKRPVQLCQSAERTTTLSPFKRVTFAMLFAPIVNASRSLLKGLEKDHLESSSALTDS